MSTPEYPAPGLVGPGDTADPATRVASARPDPADNDLRTGRTVAATAVPERPTPDAPAPAPEGPLRLAGEPRIEQYEAEAPDGTILIVTRNIDDGTSTVEWTDRKVPVYIKTSNGEYGAPPPDQPPGGAS
ncbi:hypothetical protein [Pseudonocardia sp.]|uniref:hypothetical protein n=1 Tax=Pseudonocardia sp. TaxID=60912 RepID=UPI003D0B3AEC